MAQVVVWSIDPYFDQKIPNISLQKNGLIAFFDYFDKNTPWGPRQFGVQTQYP